jgi:hypothetical protein
MSRKFNAIKENSRFLERHLFCNISSSREEVIVNWDIQSISMIGGFEGVFSLFFDGAMQFPETPRMKLGSSTRTTERARPTKRQIADSW